jgi:hypothetical protein
MDPKELHKGFWRGEDRPDETYVIHYATSVSHEEDRVGYTSGLSSCTFEAAVRHGEPYLFCTVAEFAAMVKHELKEPKVKWQRA